MPDVAAPALDLDRSAVDLTRQLCNIPSVSGEEGPLADAIEAALRGRAHLTVQRVGNTVVARTERGRARRVVIAGHIDTVPINANLPVLEQTLPGEGPSLVGRGTVDMKAGVAVQLTLAAELVDPVVDVTWIWYDNEEVSAEKNGLGRLAASHPELCAGDFAILGEPSSAGIEGGCNGTLRVELRTQGLRAHSARAWRGRNAIHALSGALHTLAGYRPATVTVDGLDYRESLSAVGISGGVAGNVIPDEAVLTVNYRFAPSRTAAEAAAVLRRLFAGYALTVVDAAEGARPGLDDPLAQEFIAAVGAAPRPKYGWTDVARFSALGIPAVNFGPGDPSRAHADDERVAIAEIVACERALRGWLQGDRA